MNQLTGYFSHVIFESSDGNRNVYNFRYALDRATLDKNKLNNIPVQMPTRQDITGEIIIINGHVSYHKKFGVQFVASNVIKTVHTSEYNPDISLHDTDIGLSSPPDMPKEYYDSMVTEYLNEQEKLYDFFTPAD